MSLPDAETANRDFLVDNFRAHVDHIRVGQARRFEILRYTFAGFFAYFAFLVSLSDKGLLCLYPFEVMVLIPTFLLFQVFLYIWIVNRNITKHGQFISYLFENGLEPLGIGPNHFRDYRARAWEPGHPVSTFFARRSLHYSQLVLVVLAGACLVLYIYTGSSPEFDLLLKCQSPRAD